MVGMTWLHLSDWHQKGEDFDRHVVRDDLIRDIEEREKISPDLAQIDFIIFSGDVAYSGKKEEYAVARDNLFEPVLQATGLPAERLFIIPGNHDLDRDAFELLPESILHPFESNEQVNKWLTNEKKRDRLREPFAAYREFVTQYTHQTQPDYSSIRRLWIDGKRVVLVGLNSAFMAGRNKNKNGDVDDYGKLITGEPQVYEVLQQISSDEVRIAVIHHPLEWLVEFERHQIEQRLKETFHLILCGHQHRSEVYQVAGTTGNCVIIPAGSSYDRRSYPNGYNFVHLNCETRRGTVYLRLWRDDENCWYKHTAPSHDDGYIKFKLPKKEIAHLPLHSNVRLTPEEKVKLEAHFRNLVARIKDGLVVPFLGADINLCDRPKYPDRISLPWSWDAQADYPPTSVELAAYLDQSHEYLKAVRCPLCDTEALPPGCPIMTEFVTRLDLQHVSQYLNIQGEKTINQAITEIAQHKYKPNRVHRFLAELPRLMNAMGYSARIRGGMASDATRYQLIVTTNFDSTLENAFVDAKQPFDLVSYTAVSANDDSQLIKQFVHQQFEHEIAGDQESPIVPKGEIKPIVPGTANENLDFSLQDRPVILKLYGPANWPDHPKRSFAITEDHFIDYLAYANSDPKYILPGVLLKKLKSSHIWFLGYSLRYWHQRVILHRIWPERENRGTERWWAVHPKPDVLDKSFLWQANDVELISEISLEKYIDELREKLEKPF